MEFTEVLRHRRMIRAFTGEPLPAGTAGRLLEAAARARRPASARASRSSSSKERSSRLHSGGRRKPFTELVHHGRW